MALRLKIPAWFVEKIDELIYWRIGDRAPDLVIRRENESDYLHRWHLLPRNNLFNLYYHVQWRDDGDGYHDHPYGSISLILSGTRTEETPHGVFIRRPGDITFRRAKSLHRLVLETAYEPFSGVPAYKRQSSSLFITGPRVRDWGFIVNGRWVHHDNHITRENGISIAKQQKT